MPVKYILSIKQITTFRKRAGKEDKPDEEMQVYQQEIEQKQIADVVETINRKTSETDVFPKE